VSSLVLVEGLVGAGKTKFCDLLAERKGYRVMYEPVNENPYLNKFYADPKRWALEMQFFLMSHRFKQHQEAVEHIWRTGQSVLMDRSIYGDKVFCHLNYLQGNIDEEGYRSYLHMRDAMFKFVMVPQVTFYLHVKPEKCLQRIQSRGRDCEKTIPVDYLQGLDAEYSKLMEELRDRGSKVIHVDWNEFQTMDAVCDQYASSLPRNFDNYPKL